MRLLETSSFLRLLGLLDLFARDPNLNCFLVVIPSVVWLATDAKGFLTASSQSGTMLHKGYACVCVCVCVCVFQTRPDNILEFLLVYKVVKAIIYCCSSSVVCVCVCVCVVLRRDHCFRRCSE